MSYAREFWIDEVSLSLHTMGLESWTAWNSKIEKTGMIKVIEYSAYEKLKAENEKLKQLILLTDPAFSHVTVTDLAIDQWAEFVRVFPQYREAVGE